jgi:hypothetical protein
VNNPGGNRSVIHQPHVDSIARSSSKYFADTGQPVFSFIISAVAPAIVHCSLGRNLLSGSERCLIC